MNISEKELYDSFEFKTLRKMLKREFPFVVGCSVKERDLQAYDSMIWVQVIFDYNKLMEYTSLPMIPLARWISMKPNDVWEFSAFEFFFPRSKDSEADWEEDYEHRTRLSTEDIELLNNVGHNIKEKIGFFNSFYFKHHNREFGKYYSYSFDNFVLDNSSIPQSTAPTSKQ